eukprot:6490335-Amphidinium_carterae.1
MDRTSVHIEEIFEEIRDSPSGEDVQCVTEQQKQVKTEDMELLTDPNVGVVLVPNINLDDLVVIPEIEPETLQSPAGGDTRAIASMMDSASALAHYEEVNTLMEEVVFETWVIQGQEKPALWRDGFANLLQELNAHQVQEDIYYPMSHGEINTNPCELVEEIIDKSSNMQIEDFAWSITDDRCHTTHPDAWGRMDHLRRADADAHGLTPTIVEDQEMEHGIADLLPIRAKAVIGPETHLKDPNFFGSSRHLQIGVYNLGNLDRRWIRHYQDPPILKILRDQPNHLQLL